MTNYSQMGVVKVMWPIFKFLSPHHMFGMGEARHFKFSMQIDCGEYQHDPQMGCVQSLSPLRINLAA